ncbi:MAG: glycosyltransferase family 25 protein [Pseudomonadales bacterium]|nr:glycosyltransferase family 25 protein [Pseudomonadales bacterium]MBO6596003.1 glycosyltransferase family 25 protein [Pseudomonadales bacterium]MBO6822486.1 glycosyltransferase family 25 protein [Pseudomonadales bacterium]
MKIFVINLERDHLRYANINEQLKSLSLDFELITAIDGKALTPGQLAEDYDENAALLRIARKMTPSEIGCALSHLRAYQNLISSNEERCLILEDDVELPTDLPNMLLQLTPLLDVKEPRVCLLSPATSRSRSRPVGEFMGYKVKPFADGYFTSSYLINKSAAKRLHEYLYPVSDVADCWKRLHDRKVVQIFNTDPAFILQNQLEFGSSTTNDHRALEATQSGFSHKAVYKARRLRSIFLDFCRKIFAKVSR